MQTFAEPCIGFGYDRESGYPSVRLSHAGTELKRRKPGS